jgi:preprotein translocase subunit SecG
MENFILILNITFAILLIISVLLQKSEGGALGLGASQDSFVSSRSAGSFMIKFTAIIASLFIITSIALTIMSKDQFSTKSVLEKVEEESKDTSEPTIPKSE